eukprot:Opistho-2@78649
MHFPKHAKFAAYAFAAQAAFVILFGLVTEYDSGLTGQNQADEITLKYSFYQDVHVMIFVGFGFLMTFLRKYGFSAVGFNFLIGAFVIQWSFFCLGFFHQLLGGTHWESIKLSVDSLISADFAAASCLIAFGAIIGKTSPLQLLVSSTLQVIVYSLNEAILVKKFNVVDIGGSMVIHAFGAYYGLATSLVMAKKETMAHKHNGSTHINDIFAMIGTIFLWMYWPSFNGALSVGPQQHRTVLNTVISLCACCVTAFLLSQLLRPSRKFEMVDIQNATLAGGVAVGAVADLYIRPYGAALIGCTAGAVSVLGYIFLQPRLERWIRLQDTCGINNLHGMPGIIGGVASIIASAVASYSTYGASLYVVFPARDPMGSNWSASHQALMQLASLGTTLGIALVAGALNGLLLRLPIFNEPAPENAFLDGEHWELPHGNSHEHGPELVEVKAWEEKTPESLSLSGPESTTRVGSSAKTSKKASKKKVTPIISDDLELQDV